MIYEGDKKSIIAYVKCYEDDKELTNYKGILQKCILFFSKFLNKIKVEKIGKNYKIILPIKNEKISEKKIKEINNKLGIVLSEFHINGIVLQNNLKQIIKLKNDKINVLNGKFVLKNMINDIILFVIGKKNKKLELLKIYILVNSYTDENIEMIKQLSNKVKCLNIVTENIKLYKKLEEQLYNEKGISITVTNNKKKSLRKAELIVNLDFKNEKIQKYNIERTAIFINCYDEKLELKSSFNGIMINYIDIVLDEDVFEYFKIYNIYNNFNKLEIYESLVYNYSCQKVKKHFIQSKIRINNLIGNRGIINL